MRGGETMFCLKKVEKFSSDITSVMAQCIHNPDTEKMNRVLKTYEADPYRIVYAYYKESKDAAAAAIIGLKLNPEQKSAVILHIAVNHSLRGNGIGRNLVNEVISLHVLPQSKPKLIKTQLIFIGHVVS
ncbi:GNAT family N-acetyltransferase [Paenibacillus radicis (ex Xue et al. 2023)]|uniref:GNAT family N-acetyltransferase n=1 Tax=Paenibacillus radicis (ex Xue et al. 2023) TaxID=2972489 RepID=A0ABT1YAF7_9BACL|nr:GNAT family N-acetyltransferase [Paenibacillus radicis (ex Xue et al. 2023)]MCR8630176.1 GNAT family N-acetyltransferase [Paenibacillus radicis (ex Xue et al. 2023)]